jgi:hypothetical protein
MPVNHYRSDGYVRLLRDGQWRKANQSIAVLSGRTTIIAALQ